ncbi:MAG: DUF3047 domain-containing protein [Burkholderiaceae bacterium]
MSTAPIPRHGNGLGPARRRLLRLASRLLLLPGFVSLAPLAARAATHAYPVGAFSRLAPGPLADESGWEHRPLKNIRPNTAEIVLSGTMPVLRIHSNASASGWAHAITGGLKRAHRLRWRWAVKGGPRQSVVGERSADDFAARVYVVFDYPLAKVPWSARLGIRIARALYGAEVPAAALCYVWHPGIADDSLAESPYTSRVRMILPAATGPRDGWQRVARDLAEDFTRAFGAEYGPGMPELQAIIVSSDTDQTGGVVDAFFGDIELLDG